MASENHDRLFSLVALALITVACCVTYWPAMNGEMLWDDDAHVTKPELRSVPGLGRIWFELGATQQYYPLLHSGFWLQHRLWGDSTLGYHLVNLLLHIGAACLVYAILRKLAIPGSLLATALFALHPVQVETVAWITEQKNTLSAVFYLGAMLAYLSFDRTRGKSSYALATGLFVLGLLSKTVTATLPAALLVIFWWQRGRLSWRRDVLPLVPHFALGAAFGVLTAIVERKLIGAEGVEFDLSLLDRVLIAGRVVWFYLGKLIWPADLMFIYPRWNIDPSDLTQWLYPLAVVAALGLCWRVRYQTRAPLATALLFVGTLFPVLGFFNVFPFRFSFVADHFQYLACLSIFVLVSGSVAMGIERLSEDMRWAGRAACVAVVCLLASLSFYQAKMYADTVELYETTLRKNPDAWLIHNNLGSLLLAKGRPPEEAIQHFEAVLRLNPHFSEAHNNMGTALLDLNRVAEAIQHLEAALRAKPDHHHARNNLGNALLALGNSQGAIEQYRAAIKLRPDFVEAYCNLGQQFAREGRTEGAIEQYRAAVQVKPEFVPAHLLLGRALVDAGNRPAAIVALREAAQLHPNSADVRRNLGAELLNEGQFQEAVQQFDLLLKLDPADAEAHCNLAIALTMTSRLVDAAAHFAEALRLRPNFPECHYYLGEAALTANQIDEAVARFEQAVRLKADYAAAWTNLAGAYARAQRAEQAIAAAETALRFAHEQNQAVMAQRIEAWLASYRPQVGAAKSESSNILPPSGEQPVELSPPVLPPAP